MQPTSDEKPRRFLSFSELARAMYGASRPPAPPEFLAEGTGVDTGKRASVPPKPRQQKASEANPPRNPKLILGLGVVDAKNEVAPELVRSGRLEMKTLAAAYREEVGEAAADPPAESRASHPRFADVMPAAMATLMLPPPTRRTRPRSGAVTLLLSAVLSAALIAATAAATLHTLRSDRGAEKAQPTATASADEPEIAEGETSSERPAAAAPQVQAPTAERVQAPTAEQQKASAKKPTVKKDAVRASKRGAKKSATRASKRAASLRVASREAKTAKKRGAPAAAKSCDEYACLMKPSLACCKESAGQ